MWPLLEQRWQWLWSAASLCDELSLTLTLTLASAMSATYSKKEQRADATCNIAALRSLRGFSLCVHDRAQMTELAYSTLLLRKSMLPCSNSRDLSEPAAML